MPRITRTERIRKLTTAIQQSPFQLVSSDETRRNERLTEGEWQARTQAFLKDHETGIPNTPVDKELTIALLSREYASHLAPSLVTRLTKPLTATPPAKPQSKEQRLAALRKKIAKTTK